MKAAHVRNAAELLKKLRLKKPTPKALVRAAQELGMPLAETLAFLIRLKRGAQDQAGQRRELLLAIAKSGGQ